MRVKHTVMVNIGHDAELKIKTFGMDATVSEKVVDGLQRSASGQIKVLANGTEDVPLGDVDSVVGIYLELNGAATVKLNGSADGFLLVTQGTGTAARAKFFLEAALSQVTIEAPVASDVEGLYCVWGDAA